MRTSLGLRTRSGWLSATRFSFKSALRGCWNRVTPPSPVRLWLIKAICLFVVLAIAWMYFGKIDVIAVAPGKIEPVGRVKVVQPIDTGRVRELLVSNGSLVHKGDVVVQLDDSGLLAEQRASADLLAASLAEARRRSVAIDAALHRWSPPIASFPFVRVEH